MSEITDAFFVAGGTVPPGSPSYVERAADRELFEALLKGEYCYVLNSRQMGKSSLAVRTVERLQAAGVRTAFVDLTRIGGANVSAEQWFAGLLAETGRVLGLRTQATEFLKEHRALGPAQRYLAFLQDVALGDAKAPLVVMIDEIDAIRSLSFSTDELFAGIRQLHNGRASEPSLRNLTFCLLGAALPSDLIRDPRTTPFNVGRRIELKDFSPLESAAFARGLSGSGAEVLVARVLYWTGGHPFLTQTLCSALASDSKLSVDQLVQERYLDARAQEADTNLADVGNRLLGRGDPAFSESDRANTLSLYSKLLKGGIPDDESNPNCAHIKMSGVARLDGGRLMVRNRIYARVFDSAWVRENMPGQELRRQRKAFWKGALRSGGVGTAVVSVIAALAVNNALLAQHARKQRDAARYDTYVASMRTLPLMLEQHDLTLIDATLQHFKNDPARGWEWDYWYNRAHDAKVEYKPSALLGGQTWPTVSGDGKLLAMVLMDGGVDISDIATGRIVKTLHPKSFGGPGVGVLFSHDLRRVLAWTASWTYSLYDLRSGTLLRSRKFDSLYMDATPGASLDGRHFLAFDSAGPVDFDMETFNVKPLLPRPGVICSFGSYSPNGAHATWVEVSSTSIRVVVRRPSDWHEEMSIPFDSESNRQPAWFPDSRRMIIPSRAGAVRIIDVSSGKESLIPGVISGEVWALSVSPDGHSILAAGGDKSAVLSSVEGDKIRTLRVFDEANRACFTPSGRGILTSYWATRLYDFPSNSEELGVSFGKGGLPRLSRQGIAISGGASPKRVNLSELHPAVERVNIPPGAGLEPSLDSRTWFRVSLDGRRVEVLDDVSGAVRRSFPRLIGARATFLSPSGKWLVMANSVSGAEICNVVDGSSRWVSMASPVSAVAFNFDESKMVLGDSYGWVTAWNPSDCRVHLWSDRVCFGFRLQNFEFSPDQRRLVVARNDDCASILDSQTGMVLHDLIGHSQTVEDATWSPDGRRIATCSDDRTVRLWDSETGRELGIIGTHDGAVYSVKFLPGGHTLASAGMNGVVKLWRTSNTR